MEVFNIEKLQCSQEDFIAKVQGHLNGPEKGRVVSLLDKARGRLKVVGDDVLVAKLLYQEVKNTRNGDLGKILLQINDEVSKKTEAVAVAAGITKGRSTSKIILINFAKTLLSAPFRGIRAIGQKFMRALESAKTSREVKQASDNVRKELGESAESVENEPGERKEAVDALNNLQKLPEPKTSEKESELSAAAKMRKKQFEEETAEYKKMHPEQPKEKS